MKHPTLQFLILKTNNMKTVIIKNYTPHLVSFLNQNLIRWESINSNDFIKIYYNDEEDLFMIGLGFFLAISMK